MEAFEIREHDRAKRAMRRERDALLKAERRARAPEVRTSRVQRQPRRTRSTGADWNPGALIGVRVRHAALTD